VVALQALNRRRGSLVQEEVRRQLVEQPRGLAVALDAQLVVDWPHRLAAPITVVGHTTCIVLSLHAVHLQSGAVVQLEMTATGAAPLVLQADPDRLFDDRAHREHAQLCTGLMDHLVHLLDGQDVLGTAPQRFDVCGLESLDGLDHARGHRSISFARPASRG